jgi:hypothetical protein
LASFSFLRTLLWYSSKVEKNMTCFYFLLLVWKKKQMRYDSRKVLQGFIGHCFSCNCNVLRNEKEVKNILNYFYFCNTM